MNSSFAPKPFSTLELVVGSAALVTVALIAFFGPPPAHSQIPLPAAPATNRWDIYFLSSQTSGAEELRADVITRPMPLFLGHVTVFRR